MQLNFFSSDDPERNAFLVPTMNMVNAYGKIVIALADITNDPRQLYEDLEKCPNPGKSFNVGYMLETSRAFCTSGDPTQGKNEWSTRGCRVSIILTFIGIIEHLLRFRAGNNVVMAQAWYPVPFWQQIGESG